MQRTAISILLAGIGYKEVTFMYGGNWQKCK